MNKSEIEAILAQVTFRDWKWQVQEKGDAFLVFLAFDAPDNDPPHKLLHHHGRKWFVSSHSVASEVVGTAWAAVQRVVLHEASEQFYYRGRRIYDPHVDVNALVELADMCKKDVRK